MTRGESSRSVSAVVAGTLAAVVAASSGCEPTNQGYAPTQPIEYSHAVHAGALQMPCQYCHFAAERGKYAGIPPASVCMNCHTQVLPDSPEIRKVKDAVEKNQPIAWKRIHTLPDHTYFEHRPHVAAKIACQTCHGPVETMGRVEQFAPLTMGFCLDCHRQQTAAAVPGDVAGATALTDCVVCHH